MARGSEWAKSSRLVTAAAILVVIAALYFAQQVLIPLAMAVLLSFLLAPAVTALERLRLPRVPAVLVVVALSFGVLGTTAWIVGNQLRDLAEDLPRYQGNIHRKMEALRAPGSALLARTMNAMTRLGQEFTGGVPASEPAPAARQAAARIGEPTRADTGAAAPPAPATRPVQVEVVEPTRAPWRFLTSFIAPLLEPLATAFIVVVFCIFMLIQREDLRDRVIRLLGQGQLTLTTQALNDAARRISRFLLMQFTVNAAYGLLIGVGLWFIGLPNAFLWGLLTSILRFVPYIGTWIAAAMPILLSFAVDPGWWMPLETMALFAVVELISYNVAEPLLYGSSTGMSALAVLVAAVFWTWLWGAMGLLLSMPLTACLVVMGKYVPQLAFLDVLLGHEPVLEPHTRVYQRLLAWDQEEATELAEAHAREKSLAEAYDSVLLPVLATAEVDHHRGELDEPRYQFVRQALREIVEELDETATAAADKAAAREERIRERNGGRERTAPQPEAPPATDTAVLCLPAAEESDEIAALMLTNLLRAEGIPAETASAKALASEAVDLAVQRNAPLLCISALPPAGVAHARYLCKRLLPRLPDSRLILGLWTAKADLERLRRRIGCADSTPVAATLAEAITQVRAAAQPILARAAKSADVSRSPDEEPGPAGAVVLDS